MPNYKVIDGALRLQPREGALRGARHEADDRRCGATAGRRAQVDNLHAAYLLYDQAIRPHLQPAAQRRAHISCTVDCDRALVELTPDVAAMHRHDTTSRRYLRNQGGDPPGAIEPRGAAHQDVGTAAHRGHEHVDGSGPDLLARGQLGEGARTGLRTRQNHEWTGVHERAADRVHRDVVACHAVDRRLRERGSRTDHALDRDRDRVFAREAGRVVLTRTVAKHLDRGRAAHQDLRDRRVREEVGERPEADGLLGDPLAPLSPLARVEVGAAQLDGIAGTHDRTRLGALGSAQARERPGRALERAGQAHGRLGTPSAALQGRVGSRVHIDGHHDTDRGALELELPGRGKCIGGGRFDGEKIGFGELGRFLGGELIKLRGRDL